MLLPTIRSRCQLMRFSPLSPEHLQVLLERSGIAPATATLLAPMSGGSMQQALGLDNETVTARREVLLQALEKLDINRIATVFEASEELSGTREATLEIIDMMISFFRDAVHLGAGNCEILNRSIRPSIESIATRRSFPRNLELLNRMYETRRDVQRNANVKLALDNLFISIAASET
jgi:DNA polymerase-3 subunit delta'